MGRLTLVALSILLLASWLEAIPQTGDTVLSAVLNPKNENEKLLNRQSRSYYDHIGRYGAGRPLYERLDYQRPSRCGRCLEDRYDDRDDDNDRSNRDRYDDDRRHRPTYGNRHDRNKYDDDDEDRRYSNERKTGSKNGTEEENNTDKKKPYDDKDRPSGGRRGSDRDRHRERDRDDDRDRYRPDYYDRFLRDPYRERDDRYDDPYRARRPYDRYPYQERYDDGYGGRYDGYGYGRPYYDDRYGRGSGYDDGYGGYGPGVGKGPHDSFRPWDETYRGQAGWDAGGRGYYFASGRPEPAPAPAVQSWGRPEYTRFPTYYGYRPEASGGWQNVGYSRDPDYRGSFGSYDSGYRQDQGYSQPSGWHSVGERRPYRDQSGVNQLDSRPSAQPSRDQQRYGQRNPDYGQNSQQYGQNSQQYGQNNQQYGQSGQTYGQSSRPYGQSYQESSNGQQSSSTTPGTSYLYQRDDERVTSKVQDETTKAPVSQ